MSVEHNVQVQKNGEMGHFSDHESHPSINLYNENVHINPIWDVVFNGWDSDITLSKWRIA